jgi:hypothetical protein
MNRLLRSSWTIVIAIVLLGAVATGVALARPVAQTAQITPAQVKRIAKSVADAEIARLGPRLSVASANSPALYAQVSRAGTLSGNSKGIAQGNISHPEPGLYCFSGLGNAPKGGMAILDALPPGAAGPDGVQVGIGSFGRCPTGTQALVATFEGEGTLVDDAFIVTFWF